MKRFTSLLLTVILFELMLGGGGRLTAFGPISLRMILFALALVTTAILIYRGETISSENWIVLILFTILLSIGLVRGVVLGASRALWWEDCKPLMYFLILPFFDLAIRDRNTIYQISNVTIRSGIILSCAFLFTLAIIHTSIISFHDFYLFSKGTEEIFFRGELTFFYKGFIFLCVALVFVSFENTPRKYIIAALLIAAILFSVTRGFVFAILLTYSSYHLLKSRLLNSVIFLLIAVLLVTTGQIIISKSSRVIDGMSTHHQSFEKKEEAPNSNLFGNKSYSDEGRVGQIKEVFQQITFSSLLIGHGFGNGIPSRPIHMEISYLEIFHKQGIIGLAFWAYLLFLLFRKYNAAETGALRNSFFFGSLLIYFQSLTNQYINNPIGLSFILLSLVCLEQLNNRERESISKGTPHFKVYAI